MIITNEINTMTIVRKLGASFMHTGGGHWDHQLGDTGTTQSSGKWVPPFLFAAWKGPAGQESQGPPRQLCLATTRCASVSCTLF